MTPEALMKRVSRITPERPVDLDEASGPRTPSPDAVGAVELPVSRRLWPKKGTVEYVGIRVDECPEDLGGIALRLASMALERQVEPIILTTLPVSGFEQFGFRVEHLPRAPDDLRADFEAEVRAFWDLAIVFDLSEAAGLT